MIPVTHPLLFLLFKMFNHPRPTSISSSTPPPPPQEHEQNQKKTTPTTPTTRTRTRTRTTTTTPTPTPTPTPTTTTTTTTTTRKKTHQVDTHQSFQSPNVFSLLLHLAITCEANVAENTAVPKVDQSLQGWEVLRYRQWKKSRKFILQINFWTCFPPKKWFRFENPGGAAQLTYPMCCLVSGPSENAVSDLLKSDRHFLPTKNPMGKLEGSNSQGPPIFHMVSFSVVYIWVFPKIGVPQNGWFIMENPIKMDDLRGTTIFGKPQKYNFSIFLK